VVETRTNFELAHVLFVDVVGYSQMLIDDQREVLRDLNVVVRGTEQFRAAESQKRLVCLPTGDGMVVAFFTAPDAAVRCAIEIARGLRDHPEISLRMGIHCGPVSAVTDVNQHMNVAGGGINMAQRVMDCGDAGHILLSQRVAEDLAQFREWNAAVHDIGETEVKHGTKLHLFNFFGDGFGNAGLPAKLKKPSAPAANKKSALAALIAGAAIIALLLFYRLGTPLRGVPRNGERGPEERALPISDKSIAVLPFENLSDDKSNAYFVDGIQDEILTRLAKVADLKVISRTSTQRFKSKPGDLHEIARQLGVAHILEGSAQRSADQVRVNVQLIKAASDTHLWAETYDRKLTDVFGVETEIATKIADVLQARLTGAQHVAMAARPTENMAAHELYLKGRFFWNKRTGDDLEKAIDYFNQAIAVDPKHALAYAGLADCYALLPALTATAPRDSFPKGKAAARKALEIDDTLAEAHASLGSALFFYDLDLPQATLEFRRAIELNPNYATGHHWYGLNSLLSLGRFDVAIAEVKRALELDPLSLIINADLGRTYYFARRYDEAIEQLHKTLEMDPNFYFAHRHLGSALIIKGDFAAAIGEYEKARAVNDDPRVLGMLAYASARSGNKAEALKILEQMKEISRQRYVSAESFALVYLGLGNKEETLRWLEQSYQDRFPEITRIKIEPLLDPLRGDPRFESLANKIIPPDVK
jgi:TolB-like protein/Flp pilus assembly protein TadD